MKKFAEKYEMLYDTIIDHDIPRWLRVTLEVPRGQNTKAIVCLCGVPVGEIISNGDTIISYRYNKNGKPRKLNNKTTDLGKAAAMVITDLL